MEEMEDGLCYGTVGTTGVGSNPDTADDSDAAALVDEDDGVFSWA
jgi:hypothetical protein